MSSFPSSSGSSLAILDDYGNIAGQYFGPISNLKIESYPTTLDPKKPDDLTELIQRLEPYEIISTMRERTPFPAALLHALPNLRLLLTTGLRNASIDLAACKERGILVAGTTGARPKTHGGEETAAAALPPPPGYGSTTQHTWSLLLALTSRIATDHARLRVEPAAWQSGLSVALGGQTLGLLGLGKLGTSMARIGALGFGMRVIAWSENLTQDKADVAAAKAGLPKGAFTAVGKQELFARADVVSIHYVLSERSGGVVGEAELRAMKKSAVLVNSSRGPLIDEQALLDTLERGGIRGAALDVFWQEPLPAASPWRTTKWGEQGRSEVVLSPHMGYVNEGTMNAWYKEQATSVEKWLKGEEVPNKIE